MLKLSYLYMKPVLQLRSTTIKIHELCNWVSFCLSITHTLWWFKSDFCVYRERPLNGNKHRKKRGNVLKLQDYCKWMIPRLMLHPSKFCATQLINKKQKWVKNTFESLISVQCYIPITSQIHTQLAYDTVDAQMLKGNFFYLHSLQTQEHVALIMQDATCGL